MKYLNPLLTSKFSLKKIKKMVAPRLPLGGGWGL
jgi:hypothetical protein